MEKAIAKLYGSYKDIPNDPVEVLEIIACTPISIFAPFGKNFSNKRQSTFLNLISNSATNQCCVLTHDNKDIK